MGEGGENDIKKEPFRERVGKFVEGFRRPGIKEEAPEAEAVVETWRGLIFDDASQLVEKVGVSEIVAEPLTGTHLMEEEQISNILNAWLTPDQAEANINAIRDYRKKEGLVLTPPIKEVSDFFEFVDDSTHAVLTEKLDGIDFANKDDVSAKLGETGLGDDYRSEISTEIDHYVRNKISQDLNAKAEKEGKSWNVPLKEVGFSLQERLSRLKLPPEKRQALLNELKKFGKTLKPKDFRELTALAARGLADFFPEIGLGLATANLVAAGGKEIRTYRRIRNEIKQRAGAEVSALSEYFSHTTLGKLLSKESETGLSKRAKAAAAVVGAASSAAAMTASEATMGVLRVPGVRRTAGMAVMRSVSQYFAPRMIDYLGARVGKFETEEQKEEWVDLALSSTSVTTTALASIFTVQAFSQAGGEIDVSKVSESLKETAASVKETLEGIDIHEADETPEVTQVIKAVETPDQEITKTATVEATATPSPEELLPDEAAVETPETATPEPEIEEKITPEQAEEVGTLSLEDVSPPKGVVEEETVNEVWFDTDGDGENDSYWRFDEETGIPTEGILADGRGLLLDPNSKGIAGLQLELAKVHHDWSPEEVAIAATRANTNGITADNLEAIPTIEKPIEVPKLGEVAEEVPVDSDGDGIPDSKWFKDKEGNIVGGVDSKGKTLAFDVRGIGTPHLQERLANMHPEWSPDEVELAAYRDGFLKGIDPNDQEALENIEKPTIETPEIIPDIKDLDRGQGFDEDYDGTEDSWWLQDKNTGEIEAGVLPDGRVLYLGKEGGTTGEVQRMLVNNNSDLSPQEVGEIAHRAVTEHEIGAAEKVAEAITQLGIIETINKDIARYSLEKVLMGHNLPPHQARELAFKKIQLESFRNDDIVPSSPGVPALSWLNLRLRIGESILSWDNVNWEEWLKEQGLLKPPSRKYELFSSS